LYPVSKFARNLYNIFMLYYWEEGFLLYFLFVRVLLLFLLYFGKKETSVQNQLFPFIAYIAFHVIALYYVIVLLVRL